MNIAVGEGFGKDVGSLVDFNRIFLVFESGWTENASSEACSGAYFQSTLCLDAVLHRCWH